MLQEEVECLFLFCFVQMFDFVVDDGRANAIEGEEGEDPSIGSFSIDLEDIDPVTGEFGEYRVKGEAGD